MSQTFFDSSALLKRYLDEVGTAWVQARIAGSARKSIIIAQITPAEIVSGIMRRVREGAITSDIGHQTRLLIDHHASRDYSVVGLTAKIVSRAEDLLENHPLRAYDSIQLASALEINDRLMRVGLPSLTFVSADKRLLEVAQAVDLPIEDVNLYA